MIRRVGLTAGLAVIASTAAIAPTPAQASPSAYWLSIGSRGNGVTCVQKIIKYLANHPGLTDDGVYGPQTAAAVADVQRFFGLQVDGVVGPQTGDWIRAIALNDRNSEGPPLGPVVWGTFDCERLVPTLT